MIPSKFTAVQIPFPTPKCLELSLKIWVRGRWKGTREAVLCCPFHLGTDLHSHLLFQHYIPAEKEHSGTIKNTRLLRQINPDQASLWLHYYSRTL